MRNPQLTDIAVMTAIWQYFLARMIEVPRLQTEEENYTKIKVLGQGSMGKVYLVQCLEDSQYYVVKRIRTQHLSEKEREAVEKEAFLLQLLDDQHVIRFKEIYTTRKQKLCIVMEYAEGGDLDKRIEQQAGKHFEEKTILTWLAQIAAGLKYIHERKIVHRDIKGANIFLSKDSECKIGDFGISKLMTQTLESTKSFVGTPSYLSPEMVEGKASGTKADMWALGVILYHLCALKLPFEANSLAVLALRIIRGQFAPLPKNMYSKELQQLILSLLKVDPRKRPSAVQILKTPLLRPYVPETKSLLEPSPNNKTLKTTNVTVQFQKQKSLLDKNNEKREVMRKQMREDLKKKRHENKPDFKVKPKKLQPIRSDQHEEKQEEKVENKEEKVEKQPVSLAVKPWKLNHKQKSAEIPVQIHLPTKREVKEEGKDEKGDGSDFVIEIKISDKTKEKIETDSRQREEELRRSRSFPEEQEKTEEQEVQDEESVQEEIGDLVDVRNALEGINLKLADLKVPQHLMLNQYQDSLDNFESVVSDKTWEEKKEGDDMDKNTLQENNFHEERALKYITKSSSLEQLRYLLEIKLGCDKFIQTYKVIRQYNEELISSNQQLEFNKQQLRTRVPFLSSQEFDSTIIEMYTLMVLENEQMRDNFDTP